MYTIYQCIKHYYLFIMLIYNETYYINKWVIVLIRNTGSIITLSLPKTYNNNNNL